jgi:hypothetical protein
MANRGVVLPWFAFGCALVAIELCAFLSSRSWDSTALLKVGVDSPARGPIERELGPLALVPTLGQDGKYFYLIARQPWFWHASAETLHGLEDPPYRYGRPLYPVLAGLGGTLQPRQTLAGLIAIQVLCGGLYAALVAALAIRNGVAGLPLYLAIANPGVCFSALFLTSDLLALCGVLAGLLCWQQGRMKSSLLLFAAAALAKDYYVLTPLALAGWNGKRSALAFAAIPLAPLVAWRLALLAVLGPGSGAGNFTLPGKGIVDAAPHWQTMPLLMGGFSVLLIAAAVVGAVRTRVGWLRWQCLVWSLLAITASHLVWIEPTDVLRVFSPLWTFAIWSWCIKPKAETGS